MFDVTIIGAGLAGLTCAQQLHQAGYRVVVLEKSRGVGGRMATRRLDNTCADHGIPAVEARGKLLQQLIEQLSDRGILQLWTDTVNEFPTPHSSVTSVTQSPAKFPRYAAPMGITAVAKFLSTGLDIRLNQRVEEITATKEQNWHLTCDSPDELTTKALVIAIPAPQALMLLTPLAETGLSADFLNSLHSVKFNPCLSAIAGYPVQHQHDLESLKLSWKSLTILQDTDLAWIGIDSSKRPHAPSPVFVLHSTAAFAQRYLDTTDLKPAGQQMVSRAAQLLFPWLETPDWLQVHRWRYAFPKTPLNHNCLATTAPLPLVCCGDWCGGNLIESAMNSGLAGAVQVNSQLQQLSLPREYFWEVFSSRE
ncbi:MULTISPECIES: NAD(P)/FAD-dependent oxidoreductase [unclassified Coleofasciculus]|uniref:NAD(P)/FAD-dependent oxidoreductase n=1 Tax=unclassified Coleofasciculus TaxID=2692782 RepID=UPI00187E4EEA|nr:MULTISPECIES: FAD-dependent oxidoreductase [unclassified Coleofasciculus]MBE9125040.1 FAD-dependent oxidoreductase [Coleofasciculus sp. LEGE 07081]MBE9147640.1 FAD-dependent oxidoreductase [Coleofasciculus sp. LEGE 07092]